MRNVSWCELAGMSEASGLLAALGLGSTFHVLAVRALIGSDVFEPSLLASDGVQLFAGFAF
ncbi:MAG TPA: hypothetical protein VJ323_11985, partial [Bryobacteraceae bacterium]|nr:hypothetical protein [Bryobacteraceae bacterium]